MPTFAGHGGTVASNRVTGSPTHFPPSWATQDNIVRRWRLVSRRSMSNVTPKGVSDETYAPGLVTWTAFLDCVMDLTQVDEFRGISDSQVRLELYRNASGGFIRATGWVERLNRIVDVDRAQILLMVVRMDQNFLTN